jgi:calcineurin-like phosphoesterase family protein
MIYFSADQHFSHQNILKLCNRPFSSIEEMNETIINNWNVTVSKNDTIYILGDFAWRNPKPFIERLNGNKIFILGGHDKKLKGEKLLEVKINDIAFVLCHFPLYSWNKEYYGSIHIHGHIHNNPIAYKHNRINVGVDVWNFYPVSIEQIIQLSNEGATNRTNDL